MPDWSPSERDFFLIRYTFHRLGDFSRSDVIQIDTFQEILHHFRQDVPFDVPPKACFGKHYIKMPGSSYPFGPEKASSRNFSIGMEVIDHPLGFEKNCAQLVYIGRKVIGYLMYCREFLPHGATSSRSLLNIRCIVTRFLPFRATSNRSFSSIRHTLPTIRLICQIR